MKRTLTIALLIVSLTAATLVMAARLDKAEARGRHLAEKLEAEQERTDGYLLLVNTLTTELEDERKRQALLAQTQEQLTTQHAARLQEIKRLQHENKELKDWAANALPTSVKCLRNRAAITSADSYSAWLSDSDGVRAACQ